MELNMQRGNQGFTLIELLVVLVIIGILAAIAVPTFESAIVSSKEAALRADLYIFRDAIDQYKGDRGEYPTSLNSLVESHYLRFIPVDPLTQKIDWVVQPSSPTSQDVYDVHTPSDKTGSNGVAYAAW